MADSIQAGCVARAAAARLLGAAAWRCAPARAPRARGAAHLQQHRRGISGAFWAGPGVRGRGQGSAPARASARGLCIIRLQAGGRGAVHKFAGQSPRLVAGRAAAAPWSGCASPLQVAILFLASAARRRCPLLRTQGGAGGLLAATALQCNSQCVLDLGADRACSCLKCPGSWWPLCHVPRCCSGGNAVGSALAACFEPAVGLLIVAQAEMSKPHKCVCLKPLLGRAAWCCRRLAGCLHNKVSACE